MPSDAVFSMIASGSTLAATVAEHPHVNIAKLAHLLFASPRIAGARTAKRELDRARLHDEYSADELERVYKCGRFPHRPSNLFLKVRLICKDCKVLGQFSYLKRRCIATSSTPSTGILGLVWSHHLSWVLLA